MFWIKKLFNLIKLYYILAKEMFYMTFTTKSRIAISYSILILAGQITIDDVPDVGNLRVIVLEILSQ
ncbi:hypothetical protein SAMN02745120_1038 [Acetoanaerobium noterae]|uniref:Uncharacterized protein n=1 Tax=Acetoanaerobium noterae TaxID=745369 RepID=A0A1T5AMM0_9FIRM|nr:hypothetical protein SAMN02745120_1038 [Acetoanaerobium noterae]